MKHAILQELVNGSHPPITMYQCMTGACSLTSNIAYDGKLAEYTRTMIWLLIATC